MPPLKKGPKVILLAVVVAALFFGVRHGMNSGLIPMPGFMKADKIKTEAALQQMQDQTVSGVAAVPLPTSEPANLDGPELRDEVWAWNAQIGTLYAIGGKATTKGSLMAKYGVNATVRRQDDTEQMKNDLIAYSQAYAGGNKNPSEGVNAIHIMGSQTAGFFAAINPLLAKFGDKAVAVYVAGRSDGEDAVMGPASWKSNPQAAKGGVVSVVPLEGDADLLKKWVKDNDLKFNPDAATYDPDAVNVIAASTYIDAADKYISGYSEDRPVVHGGRKTNETKHVTIDAVSTWTPGDVKVAKGKGGLVRVVSTHEYSGQMPNTLIVLKRWADDNRPTLVNALRAMGEAGAQVVTVPTALNRACEISAQVYDEQDAAYWCKYYRGVTEADRQGKSVQLGGSRAANLADNKVWFGIGGGRANIFAHTYTTFGNMLVELYPTQLKAFPPADDVIDLSYLNEALAAGNTGAAEQQVFTSGASGNKVAKRSWHINFRTGSAELTPAAEQQLAVMLNDLVIAQNLAVEVQGHTDNVGNEAANQSLSERRAFAVKQYLEQHAAENFPEGRITPRAFGATQPVQSNDTETGRAANRRVDVILRTAQ